MDRSPRVSQRIIDEIEAEVFGGNASVSRRIYALAREVIGFRRAAHPLNGMLESIIEGEVYGFDPELHRYLRDVQATPCARRSRSMPSASCSRTYSA